MPKLAEKAFADTFLRSVKSAERTDHYDAVQRGLGLRVAPSGLKTWFVMKRIDGRQKRITIGRYPEVPLTEARKDAARLLAEIAAGKNPQQTAVPTFAEMMEDWFRRDQQAKRSAHEKRRALAKDVVPRIGKVRVDAITRADLRALLEEVVDRGAPIHANRLLAYLRRLFNWAVERDVLATSPAIGIKPLAAERSRDRTLNAAELAAVWQAANNLSVPFDRFIKVLILTGQRRNEVAGMRWSEIDFDRNEWTIPAARAKNGKAHIVHLSRQAVDIVSCALATSGTDLVFTTTGSTPISGFSRVKSQLDMMSGVIGWTIHDLRRTFATIATGDLGIDPVVIDKILNHSSGAVTGIAAVYQRHAYLEQRRAAIERWGQYVRDLEPSDA